MNKNIPINKLKASPTRKINLKTNYAINLEKSIKENGILVPLIINDDNQVIDGNYRLAIAKSCGIKTVPCRMTQ